jgi:DNA-binding response OmpR family regulator
MKILIADDEPEILKIVSKWLSRKGHEVLTTSDRAFQNRSENGNQGNQFQPALARQ